MVEQRALLNPGEVPEVTFAVYHDESGTYKRGGGDRWLIHGVILVPALKQHEAFSSLQQVRSETEYWEEVHYKKLRNRVTGSKGRCTIDWLNTYASRLSNFCFYYCLAIDTKSPSFEHDRFSNPYYVYNRFVLMALVGAIAWFLKPYQRVALKLHSDAKSRAEGDNFASYIPREILRTIEKKRSEKPNSYPEIELLHPQVILIDSNPTRSPDEMQEECELTQLADLLTSAIAQAITGSSGQKGKISLAETVGRWIEDTRKPPWLQTRDLYRRFSVSCFPDENGSFYNPELAVKDHFKIPLFKDLESGLV
jgi:hypothetical protein